ncbi:MAG: VWA domain-containing protein, partial [Alistipes sp.]|nr:VWA domain-containing protein [Alistipes sp.]
MNTDSIKFRVKGKDVTVSGYPELEGCEGTLGGYGMAFFFGDNRELYIANTQIGKIRKVSTGKSLLVADNEIDIKSIAKVCENGIGNAQSKVIRYAGLNRWDGFKDGLCAISWMLYPDGRYFADSDGFGMEDNDEEVVYAIIDTDLNIVEPFRPIDNIEVYLKKLRKNNRTKQTNDKLMKTRIFNLIIIDESGSMQSIKRAAIDSVNETIQTIRSAQKKHEDQEHYVSLVTFNDDVKTVYECVPVDEVKELTAETYQPDCCTALYDAMGISLNALRKKVAEDDKVLVTVVTDGYENASKEYSGKAIKALVDELKAKGWVFAYMGANQDVEAVAATISITNVMQFEATPCGTADMSSKLS